ncbi:glycosyltransferase family A protein [Janthinobacterium sp.]|uniref:glycosyltransferase family 2 protein n=1 Tax=Janthinobacterium sp. TaxID=1871054 RepID=UPI0025BC453A|nr:glycosyltransferase family A protein [Janthinobacterium sp.]NBV18966.1 glycosyltransferase family 2 protein [Janthinobacterium sp.]
MLCSVIIPLYNKEHYIAAAIASVMAQSHQEFEIVVVDDGSRDGGAALVEAMPDPRIRLLRQANGGVSRARNAGIAAARGELVCFLDADDWYGKDFLKAMVSIYQKYPEDSFFSTSFLCMHDPSDGRLDEAADADFEPIANFYAYRAAHGVFYCTNSIAVPRRHLMAMPYCFPEGDQFGEDQDLWFRLAERLQLVFTPARLVAYRSDVAGSLCTVYNLRTLPQVFSRLEQRASRLPAADPSRHPALSIVADARIKVARYALQDGRRGEALGELRRALRGGMSMRWLVTFVMCTVGNASLLKRWEMWRELKRDN